MVANGVEGLTEPDEIARDQLCPLVNQLIEGMLAVRPGLSPDDRSGFIRDVPALEIGLLAVAFHIELLEVSRKAAKVMVVRQNRHGLGAEEVVVPDAKKSENHRKVAFEGRRAEVLVHRV